MTDEVERQYMFISPQLCYMISCEHQTVWATDRFSISKITAFAYIDWLLAHPSLSSSDEVSFALLADRLQQHQDKLTASCKYYFSSSEERNGNF
ncbi:MAG: hypothetical protein KF690_11425 [Bacteroidetes bacterium]|nr:hypothetical protein [Bacteroidota bacterium]